MQRLLDNSVFCVRHLWRSCRDLEGGRTNSGDFQHTFLVDPFLFDTMCCCLREVIHCVLSLWSSQSEAITHRVNTWFHCSNSVTQFQQNSSQSRLYPSWVETSVLDFGQIMSLNAVWVHVWSSHISREENKLLRKWHYRSYYYIITLDMYFNITVPRLRGGTYTTRRSSFIVFYCYWPAFYFTRESRIVPHWFESAEKKKIRNYCSVLNSSLETHSGRCEKDLV